MNYNLKKVRHCEAQKDKFEDECRKRDCNPPTNIKRLDDIMKTIRKKVDPNWNKKGKSKSKNRLPDEIKVSKEQLNNMKQKSLNKIKIQKDELYKNIDNSKHYLKEGYKTIDEINKMILHNKNETIPLEEIKENSFSIDPKVFESSEEEIVLESKESKVEPKNSNSKRSLELIISIIKKIDKDIETYKSSIVSNDTCFDNQNNCINKIIIILNKLKSGFEKAKFIDKYTKDQNNSINKSINKDIDTPTEQKEKKRDKKKEIKSKDKKNYIRLLIHKLLIEDRPIDFDELYSKFDCIA